MLRFHMDADDTNLLIRQALYRLNHHSALIIQQFKQDNLKNTVTRLKNISDTTWFQSMKAVLSFSWLLNVTYHTHAGRSWYRSPVWLPPPQHMSAQFQNLDRAVPGQLVLGTYEYTVICVQFFQSDTGRHRIATDKTVLLHWTATLVSLPSQPGHRGVLSSLHLKSTFFWMQQAHGDPQMHQWCCSAPLPLLPIIPRSPQCTCPWCKVWMLSFPLWTLERPSSYHTLPIAKVILDRYLSTTKHRRSVESPKALSWIFSLLLLKPAHSLFSHMSFLNRFSGFKWRTLHWLLRFGKKWLILNHDDHLLHDLFLPSFCHQNFNTLAFCLYFRCWIGEEWKDRGPSTKNNAVR